MDVPQQIGSYPVERLLGAGAMGSVFLARHPATNEPLAIKVLHERDPELIARFRREAEVMARIVDPRVVRALDAGLHEGEPFLVLEYCPGQDLAELLKKRGALEPRQAAELVAEIGRGLAAAHALGVLHRDLKPANVLLDAAGTPKVADFGLARVQKEPGADSLTQSGVVMGTPAYMAPEQAHDARQVDARSDVYALGAILYECLSGKRPFGTGGVLAVLQRVCEGELEPLPEALPRELVEVVTCAMALDPADRFSEVSLFVAALGEALATPTQARSAGWAPLAAGAGLLVALALGVTWGMGSGPEVASATPHRTPLATPLRTPREAVPSSPSPVVTASPEASPTPAPRVEFPRPESSEYLLARVRFWKAPRAELRAAAAAGHPAAQVRWGDALLNGRGVPKDAERGLKLVRSAAEAGDTEAMIFLFSESNYEEREWLERAAEAGSPQALLSRALMENDEAGVRDAGQAARERLAEGDPAACAAVAIYSTFTGDFEAAAEVAKLGCRLGVPYAFSLRARLARARGEAGSAEVYRDFSAAARHHDPEGLCGQARWLLDQKDPTQADRDLAERLLSEAEELGHRGAQVERVVEAWRQGDLPLWLERLKALAARPRSELTDAHWGDLGVHVNQVYDEIPQSFLREVGLLSLRLILRARPHRSLDPRVSFYRAIILHRRTPKERAEAVRLFQRAAEAGHPQAGHAWGVALVRGDSVEQNVPKGLEVLKAAAEAGHVLSWKWLGDIYASASAGGRDLEEAVRCYEKGAESPETIPGLYSNLTLALVEQGRYREARVSGERALELGEPVGSGCLGDLLLRGLGGPRNAERGVRLLKTLVDRKTLAPSQLPTAKKGATLLEEVYRLGQDVPQDLELAERYRARAEFLRQRLIKLRGSLPPG